MKLSARILVSALTATVVLAGLLAAPAGCAMGNMGPSVAGSDHACCPTAPAKITADCCTPTIAPATAPSKLPERSDAGASANAALVGAEAQPPVLIVVGPAAAGVPPLPLDSLAQSCILRI